MKTSNESLQSPNTSLRFLTILFTLFTILKAIWQRLIRTITNSKELQVWKTTDRHGHTYWHAYDPTTERSISVDSEAEMRSWIEQRYYQSK
jgi:hypothetical protein